MAQLPDSVHICIYSGAKRIPASEIRLTPGARRKLLEAMPVHDMLYCLADEACDDLDNPEWRSIEQVLTEILMPVRSIEQVLTEILMPVRYITGIDASTDRCQRCDIRARHAGDFLCSECRAGGDPS